LDVIGLHTTMLIHYFDGQLLENLNMGIHIHDTLLELHRYLFSTCIELFQTSFILLHVFEFFLQLFNPSILFFVLEKQIYEVSLCFLSESGADIFYGE
jgi:hypothetical protein